MRFGPPSNVLIFIARKPEFVLSFHVLWESRSRGALLVNQDNCKINVNSVSVCVCVLESVCAVSNDVSSYQLINNV